MLENWIYILRYSSPWDKDSGERFRAQGPSCFICVVSFSKWLVAALKASSFLKLTVCGLFVFTVYASMSYMYHRIYYDIQLTKYTYSNKEKIYNPERICTMVILGHLSQKGFELNQQLLNQLKMTKHRLKVIFGQLPLI